MPTKKKPSAPKKPKNKTIKSMEDYLIKVDAHKRALAQWLKDKNYHKSLLAKVAGVGKISASPIRKKKRKATTTKKKTTKRKKR